MINIQVTAFHVDFSTLEIEKGEKALPSFGFNYTIQPTLQIEPTLQAEGLVIEAKQHDQAERPVQKRRKRRR